MKKTYNINIAGYGFIIDEDAYTILDSYLSTLGQACGRAGQGETASDIEQRIAEIFMERRMLCPDSPLIISRRDVEEVIGRMGTPEEIVDVETEAVSPAGPSVPPPPPYGVGPVQKRLYRDIDHRLLGGVCSGLAWYLNIDVVWVRLIMVALAFLSGSVMVLIYIVLWIVIPPARSPYERMQMMGVDPSVSNVGKVVTGAYTPSAPGMTGGAPVMPGNGSAANVGRVIVMVLTVVGLLISGALLLALSLAFLGCGIAVCVIPGSKYSATDIGQVRLILGCVIGGSLVAGLPIFLLFRWLLGVLTNQTYRPFTLQQRLFIAVPWLLGVAACIVCGILLGRY